MAGNEKVEYAPEEETRPKGVNSSLFILPIFS